MAAGQAANKSEASPSTKSAASQKTRRKGWKPKQATEAAAHEEARVQVQLQWLHVPKDNDIVLGAVDLPVMPGPLVANANNLYGSHFEGGYCAPWLPVGPQVASSHRKARKAGSRKEGRMFRAQLLLQACWDHHSPGGCTRMGCGWRHCELDPWQSAWLRLQRFCLGSQLGTFESFEELVEAVQMAFQDEVRLEAETPRNTFLPIRAALSGLSRLGYPFKVSDVPESHYSGDKDGHAHRSGLLESIRAVASEMPGSDVFPVGSFAWDIDTEGSDLDAVITKPSASETELESLDMFLKALRRLQLEGRAPAALQSADVTIYGQGTGMPVLAIRIPQLGTEPLSIDICTVGQLSSIRDALLFRHMFVLMPQLPEVLQLLKRWLRLRAVPTSCEGGYPQIFWMRLAARTFQTVSTGHSKKAEAVAEGSDTGGAGIASQDNEVREQLRSFCSQWSRSLPVWGECLNLVGEEASPHLKRLASGVYGATALLCLRELRSLAETASPEELPRVEPRNHLCPAKAGFWAAFYVPGEKGDLEGQSRTSSPQGSPRSAPGNLVAGWVSSCSGQPENVRLGFYARAQDSSGCVSKSGCAEGIAMERCEFISRKDCDCVMVVEVASKESDPAEASRPRRMALFPQHFVCLLDGDPSKCPSAEQSLRELQDLLASPSVANGLPPPYPLKRYSRRVLLNALQERREAQKLKVAEVCL
eukprot:CAMPEP_0197635512 /NCGR_PEP_ID=MMETSP1338-20131121/11306_1 /TAXON_ID=43686 ORGANISM="Pelagodinium beii, Strain RCC1491" /NCGR_SAMPLE_ID=MMETSP1338 /ASSEMBLY_ACC=CAM_ASM_000754 /LENGTH=702 /DNA_ID=CAMNT_0043207579 /DNA_START=20 /DNA_END=2128 /DNA_ORIENTATION=-